MSSWVPRCLPKPLRTYLSARAGFLFLTDRASALRSTSTPLLGSGSPSRSGALRHLAEDSGADLADDMLKNQAVCLSGHVLSPKMYPDMSASTRWASAWVNSPAATPAWRPAASSDTRALESSTVVPSTILWDAPPAAAGSAGRLDGGVFVRWHVRAGRAARFVLFGRGLRTTTARPAGTGTAVRAPATTPHVPARTSGIHLT